MPATAEKDRAIHPAEYQLTERDMEPVKDLLDEVRRHELERKLIAATVTWLNAFTQFKRMRNRHGLPTGESATHFYGMLLADLKATGKLLLCCQAERMFDLQEAAVTEANFKACVRELECDDVILGMGLLAEGADFSDIERVLGHV
jgi:hypothetical protein